jgi:uncharacterized protein YndB with AHSA1/START domain
MFSESIQVLARHELVITRTFDAPRSLVWAAWTNPKHIMQWWGPQGFSNSSCELDLRVGGSFHLNMCAPDGNCYPCKGTYREIVEQERIVFDSEADDSHPCGAGLPPRSLVTITFAENNNRTTLTIHTVFESEARREAAVQARFNTSWAESLERLAVSLKQYQSTSGDL